MTRRSPTGSGRFEPPRRGANPLKVLAQTPTEIVVRAPAKLNLYLDVLRRREDRFHEIESVMQTIDLCDRVTIKKADEPKVELVISGRPCPDGPTNLVLRAANALFERVQARVGLQVNLEKNIPLGAGLGGGSADAAAMLWGLNQLMGGLLAQTDLEEIGARLGSDVPFFFTGGTAIARGRGEQIEALGDTVGSHLYYLVAYPNVEVSTAAVYGNLNLGLKKTNSNLDGFLKSLFGPPQGVNPGFENALEQPFRSANPELAVLQDQISQVAQQPFMVTGSGSAMFTTANSRKAGTAIAESLQEFHGVDLFLCSGLSAEQA